MLEIGITRGRVVGGVAAGQHFQIEGDVEEARELTPAGQFMGTALIIGLHGGTGGGHPEIPTGQLAVDGALGARAR